MLILLFTLKLEEGSCWGEREREIKGVWYVPMAAVSHMPVNAQQGNLFMKGGVKIQETRPRRRGELIVDTPVHVVDESLYVAVGKEVSEGKQTLMWALHNSGGKRICILHVHQPAQRIPCPEMGMKLPVDQLEESQVRAHREKEKQAMNKILNEYTKICERAGVRPEVQIIGTESIEKEPKSIEKKIVDFLSQHDVRKLVMGAAAAKSYSKKMLEPKSKKAIYVLLHAPVPCRIMFICKGNLIHTREAKSQEISPELGTVINHATPSEIGEDFRSQSDKEACSEWQKKFNGLGPDFLKGKSYSDRMKVSTFTPSISRGSSPQTTPNSMGIYNGGDGGPTISPAYSCFSASSDFADNSASTSAVGTEIELELPAVDCSNVACQLTSPLSMLERGLNDGLYDHLKQAYEDAENAKQEAFKESMRRSKAEKDALGAFCKAKASEVLLAEEVRQRKEIEESLYRCKEEIQNMKQQLEVVMKELLISQEHNSYLENRIANSDRMVEELEQKMKLATELLQKNKKERDELQVERDNALNLAEELREKQAEEASSALVPECFSEFSFSEIEEASGNFNSSMKIGEGGYGNIYKGLLRHTQVAIKRLNSSSSQGPAEFQQEVNILTKLRHPNLVTLIGACPEAWILIYELYPNGSLEDRLSCKDNTPPLSWQMRIHIATELCLALIFLHSCSPHSLVHGDLKPANIMLDAHFVVKLGDFGISRFISDNEFTSNGSTPCQLSVAQGTLGYVDPEFVQTGELTIQSDVYSYGIIVLQLLTGRSALVVRKDVQCALQKGNLKELLDPTAGEWPFVQAEQLARLAMRCCDLSQRVRPNLVSEVWRVLEPMRISCGASSSEMGSCTSSASFSRK